MKKLNGRGLSLVARFLFMAVATVFAVASASAADTLYLRAVNGDWDASASDQYKMTLVKDEGDLQVYNWTGKIPSSFVIASDDYSVCLGVENPLVVNAAYPSQLMSVHTGSSEAYISITGKTDRNADDLLCIKYEKGQWEAKIMLPLFITDYIDDDEDFVNLNSPMISSFVDAKNLYEWDGSLPWPFRILQAKSGKVAFDVAKLSGSSESSKISLIGQEEEYVLGTNGRSGYYIQVDEEEMTDGIHIQLINDLGNGIATLMMTDASSLSDPAYCLLQEDGSILPLEDDDFLYYLTTGFAFGGFVVAEYDRSVESPTYSDLTGYYTNRGGVSYYYDELLSKIKGMPENREELAFMTLADLPDAEREMTFKFNPEKSTLRVDGDTECVHIPIYFFNGNLKHGEEPRFEKPHIRVENTSGKYYTDPQGSAMYQHEVNLYDADPSFWRFDLWIPENELNSARNVADSPSKTVAPYAASQLLITPNRASAIGSSNLHLTFTDGKGTSVIQFKNAPILKAGVYSLNEDDDFVSPLNEIYMIIEVGGGKSAIVLPQSTDGQYLFTGTIGPGLMTENSPELSFYIATKVDNNNQPEGTVYGAPEDVTTDVISDDLNSAITHNNYEGTMVRGSDNPWVIDYNQLPADRKDQDIALSIEIGPDNAPTISFGYSANDFQTVVEEIVGTYDEIIWFNLQGVRLSAPVPGLNIMVRGSKAQKVLI